MRLAPKSTALLVIDVQERLALAMDKTAWERVVKSIDLLLTAAELLSAPTLATEQYPKGLGPTVAPLRSLLDARQIPKLEKTTFSALAVPEVPAFLEQAAPKAVVVVGVEAHVCVYQSVRALVERGLAVHVPHDAVLSRREDDKSVALDLMRSVGATITTSETVVFDWLERAEGDAFKALSKKMR